MYSSPPSATGLSGSPALRWLAGSSYTYLCETESSTRVNQLGMTNRIRSVVAMQVLEQSPAPGSYAVRVEVLRTEQSQQQGLQELLTALNLVSTVLEVEVDPYGYARRILNRPALLAKWLGVRAALRQRYRQFPQTEPLLAGLDQQVQTPGLLETAMLPYGVYGLLFAGLLGRSFVATPATPAEPWNLPSFLGGVDLPLLLHKRAVPAAGLAPATVELAITAELDHSRFDAETWRRLLRQITDTPTLDTTFSLHYEAGYELARLDGSLRQARQHLRVEVPGVYCNEVTHHLSPYAAP